MATFLFRLGGGLPKIYINVAEGKRLGRGEKKACREKLGAREKKGDGTLSLFSVSIQGHPTTAFCKIINYTITA